MSNGDHFDPIKIPAFWFIILDKRHICLLIMINMYKKYSQYNKTD